MPGTMTDKENLLSLVSIEVLVSDVHINLNLECHLPCIVFRLLDYPAVSIPYFDQWQLDEFHHLKSNHPNISWRQLLSDQFYELRSANGKFSFKRGKSCLFKTYFKTLYTHLLNVPLFLLLIDQIHDSNTSTSHFVGSCNVKLNELIEILNQSIIKNGNDIPLVEQQTFCCTLFNLMGTIIGTCDVAVRLCHYGTTILTQLPMLNDEPATKSDKKVPVVVKEAVIESMVSSPATDTIVKQIHFVNEKKDVGLQLSRNDLPSSSTNNKCIQTRWTSTKTRPRDYHQSNSRYLRTIEDPSLDDPTMAFYRPPALYFNSDSDFLQMMPSSTTKTLSEAKKNRLSYLASIPIASFDEQSNGEDVEKNKKHQTKRKSISNVRFNLPTTGLSQVKLSPKQQTLTKDFLHHFPLLRSLVEEALALQQHQYDMPMTTKHVGFNERPYSAVEQKHTNPKQSLRRPKSATHVRSKSVIIPRNLNNSRQLHPPSSQKKQMIVTKNDMHHLVDRLSKPKVHHKKVDREVLSTTQNKSVEKSIVTVSPRRSSKHVSISSVSTVEKPPPSYGITRAHRLMTEFSRARRAAFEPQVTSSPKSQTTPRKDPVTNNRIPPSSPPIVNTGAIPHLSLLNKVDVDSITIQKNMIQPSTLEKTPDNINPTIKSVSATSQDATLKLNQTLLKTISSDFELIVPPHQLENDDRKDDLAFSITDITDYFTDGGESSTRPPTRQST